MQFDVVVAGAGIGGAVLALALGTRGRRVALVERETVPPRLVRPEVLWGTTPRALARFGIADAVRHTASVQVEAIEIGAAKPWLRITADDFTAAGTEAFSTNPSMTRALIADAATATANVEILRGVTVDGLLYAGRRVTGVRARRGGEPLAIEASLVVGDDGGKSIVRSAAGIPIALQAFPIEFVTAPVTRWPLPPGRARVWIEPKAFGSALPAAALIPWPGNEGVLLVPVPAVHAKQFLEQSPESFWAALARVTPLAGALREQLEFPRDFARVARPFGHAAAYVADGVALIGDAIHPMTPAGGQGANASIWDALALADVADAALRAGDVSRERLLPYERLRRPRNEDSVSISRTARRAFRAARLVPSSLLPMAARTVDAWGWPKRRIIRSFATTFSSYGTTET